MHFLGDHTQTEAGRISPSKTMELTLFLNDYPPLSTVWHTQLKDTIKLHQAQWKARWPIRSPVSTYTHAVLPWPCHSFLLLTFLLFFLY